MRPLSSALAGVRGSLVAPSLRRPHVAIRAFASTSPALSKKSKKTTASESEAPKAPPPPRPTNDVPCPPPDPSLADTTVPFSAIARARLAGQPIRIPSYTVSSKSSSGGSSDDPANLLRPSLTTLPYRVTRTASGQLPVYHELSGGGATRKTTVVRRIEGDAWRLRMDMVSPKAADGSGGLGLPPQDVSVRNITGHVVVKVSCFVVRC